MVSIIIPTYNRLDMLIQCLNCLLKSISVINVDYEIIITDDSDNDFTKKYINNNYDRIKYLKGPHEGPAANRNNGAINSKFEWLIFIDDDCLPDTNLIYSYLKSINNYKNILAFEGRIIANTNKSSFIEESPINVEGLSFWSCNICIHKKIFNKLGGFDSNYPYAAMEDVDFYYRIKQNKIPTMFIFDAFVIHPWRKNKKIVSLTLKRYKSQLFFIKKYPSMKKVYNEKFYLKLFIIENIYLFKNFYKYSDRFLFFVNNLLYIFFVIDTINRRILSKF